MARTLLAVILLALGFAVLFAPAALLRHVAPPGGGVELAGLSGTVWRGHADLVIGGRSAGRLAWRLAPVTILQGALGYHLALTGPGQDLSAALAIRPTRMGMTVDGAADSAFVNQWLGAYDIILSGRLTFEAVHLEVPYAWPAAAPDLPVPGRAGGILRWTGGPVRYQLAQQTYQGTLPPLEALFGDALQAVVFATGDQTPLLQLDLLSNGFIRIGMTRRLTRMLDNPWPGGEADHEVVLVVEEQLF